MSTREYVEPGNDHHLEPNSLNGRKRELGITLKYVGTMS